MASAQVGGKRPADESTSLLPGSLGSHFGFNTSIRSEERPISNGTSDDENDDDYDDDEDVDINELSLSLARVTSLTSGTGLDPGTPHYVKDRPKTVEIVKPQQRVSSVCETPDLENAVQADAKSNELSDPRFINITSRRFWTIFSVVMLTYFVACFDSTLMASSHPVITSYFEASQAAPWLSTVFLITCTAFQPLFGRLSDMVGRKPIFTFSLAVFGLTTIWCALATSI